MHDFPEQGGEGDLQLHLPDCKTWRVSNGDYESGPHFDWFTVQVGGKNRSK